ncbi:hypothetical protein OESDEN_05032 [Oesophagostomum dentatum]|uniref:Uncharacterized protein n=1 Tax=Oesophagostomum dentatum TaxID=61180 RepID=A0A0B1TBV4_OESDE|nr:hypothetical protein OESDEN_05032 [Oesophagostomum dentatum]
MLPVPCSSYSNSQRSDIQRRVRKAKRDAMVDLVTSTIDVFLSKPCEDPQVLAIRVPDINVTIAEVTPDEASLIVNNPYYDKMLEAAENKKRVHAACAAARQFLVEHTVTKNPFPPELQKTRGIAPPLPKSDRVDINMSGGSRQAGGKGNYFPASIKLSHPILAFSQLINFITINFSLAKNKPTMRFSTSSSSYNSTSGK